jgi:enoyl-[acyl-carrier protein] reductase I
LADFQRIENEWGQLDLCLHSIGFAPAEDLQGRVVDFFLLATEISFWSFIRMAKLAEPFMKKGGALFTMTSDGSQMVVDFCDCDIGAEGGTPWRTPRRWIGHWQC